MLNEEKIAVYPGSFDPITKGHIDVIERASFIFDKVIVLVGVNSKKTNLFTEDERCHMATQALKHLHNAEVSKHQGLIVEYCRQYKAIAMIRGIRAVSDFEYEFQIALMNRKLEPEVHTVFMMPHEKYTYLNSTIVRELARYQKDTSDFVPEYVSAMLAEKFKDNSI